MKILCSNILQNIILLQLMLFSIFDHMSTQHRISLYLTIWPILSYLAYLGCCPTSTGVGLFDSIMCSLPKVRRHYTLKTLILTYLLIFDSSGYWWNITILMIYCLLSKDVCATRMRALGVSFIWLEVRMTWDRREAKRGWVEMGVGRDGWHLNPYCISLWVRYGCYSAWI